MDYRQPEFYKFSQDSLELAQVAIKNSSNALNCLDLGSGCGVVGIEVANKLSSIKKLTLLERQSEFSDFLNINCKNMLRKKITYEILINTFSEFNSIEKFDIITANLPYFLEKDSRPSPDKNKDICRRWKEECIIDVVNILDKFLNKEAKAFLILDIKLCNYFQGFEVNILRKFKNVAIIAVSREKLKVL